MRLNQSEITGETVGGWHVPGSADKEGTIHPVLSSDDGTSTPNPRLVSFVEHRKAQERLNATRRGLQAPIHTVSSGVHERASNLLADHFGSKLKSKVLEKVFLARG